MANNIAFQVNGKTTRINVTTSANTVAILSDSPSNQVRVHNGTATEIFIRLSNSSVGDVVIPTAGTPAYGVVLHNNATIILTTPAQSSNTATLYLSAIAASGTGIIYATPGEGL